MNLVSDSVSAFGFIGNESCMRVCVCACVYIVSVFAFWKTRFKQIGQTDGKAVKYLVMTNSDLIYRFKLRIADASAKTTEVHLS